MVTTVMSKMAFPGECASAEDDLENGVIRFDFMLHERMIPKGVMWGDSGIV
jgi:hypothetical protein